MLISFCALELRLSARDLSANIGIIEFHQHLAGLYLLAFAHIYLLHRCRRGTMGFEISNRFDFPVRRNRSNQILSSDAIGTNGNATAAAGDESGKHDDSDDCDDRESPHMSAVPVVLSAFGHLLTKVKYIGL